VTRSLEVACRTLSNGSCNAICGENISICHFSLNDMFRHVVEGPSTTLDIACVTSFRFLSLQINVRRRQANKVFILISKWLSTGLSYQLI
jgi:hypothetical protein